MTETNALNGGQMIVDYLIRNKVPYAFGLCGHGNIGLIDALHERQDDIATISVHHESVSGFMADVYYRVTGQPTATFTSCGPGSANMPIALGNSFLDSVPYLAVTGNVPTSQFNRGAFQELYRHHQADFPSTVRAYCKRVYQPTRGDQMPHTIREAWKTMVTGRPGPVVLDVPFDIFKESTGAETPDPRAWVEGISCRAGADPEGVETAARMLMEAERPLAPAFSVGGSGAATLRDIDKDEAVAVNAVQMVGDKVLYRRGNTWYSYDVAQALVAAEAEVRVIERFSAEYFRLAHEATPANQKILAAQRDQEEVIIRQPAAGPGAPAEVYHVK